MKVGQPRLLGEAAAAMRQSGRWWDAFDRCVHRVRFWNVRYALRKCLYNLELEEFDRGDRANRLEALKRGMDKAHDMKLIEENNLSCCAEQARAAETMARICYEEHEEREWQTIPNPQRWEIDG